MVCPALTDKLLMNDGRDQGVVGRARLVGHCQIGADLADDPAHFRIDFLEMPDAPGVFMVALVTFDEQEAGLELRPAAGRKAGQRTVGAQAAVAGHDERHRVGAHDPSNRARGARAAGTRGQLAVGDHGSGFHLAQRTQHLAGKIRASGQVDGDVAQVVVFAPADGP